MHAHHGLQKTIICLFFDMKQHWALCRVVLSPRGRCRANLSSMQKKTEHVLRIHCVWFLYRLVCCTVSPLVAQIKTYYNGHNYSTYIEWKKKICIPIVQLSVRKWRARSLFCLLIHNVHTFLKAMPPVYYHNNHHDLHVQYFYTFFAKLFRCLYVWLST